MREKKCLRSYFKQEKYRIIIFLAACIGVGLFYFAFPLMIPPDSAHYYKTLRIFRGEDLPSTWPAVRGFSLPVVLYAITVLFGDSERGILAGTFMLFLIYFLLVAFLERKIRFRTRIASYFMSFLTLALLVFNPILIGYMHALLTEFVAIPLVMLAVLLAYKWLTAHSGAAKILLAFALTLLCVFSWFLKQPYIFLAWAPLFISAVISIFECPRWKNVLLRIAAVFLSVAAIFMSISLWNGWLTKTGAIKNSNSQESYLREAIINGCSQFEWDPAREHYTEEYLKTCNLISDEDKSEIIKVLHGESEYKSFQLINVYYDFGSRTQDNIEAKLVLFSRNNDISVADALKQYFKLIVKHPKKMLRSYAMNYFAISDVAATANNLETGVFYPTFMDEPDYCENRTLSFAVYYGDSNVLWDKGYPTYKEVENLYRENTASQSLRETVADTFDTYNFIYKAAMLLLPLASIAMLIKRLRHKTKEYRDVYDLGLILLGTALIHVLFHVCMGAIIDRYAFVVFPLIIIGLFILFSSPKQSKKEKEEKKDLVGMEKMNKILFVIPAHNEGENIQKVIDELRSDAPGTDILVINDASSDDTHQIVERNGIPCIDTVYNFKYAYALQTGIKYAYENDYDCVIQFDGDGQHIASEAVRLLDKMKETGCDIVIGSRYMRKGDYHASFFRKLGTKIFSGMIYLFCHKKITDALSGFQALNKKVIAEYAKMGNYPEFPDANLVMEMLYKGYDIQEVPVKMRNREFGVSMHSGILKPIKYMLLMFYTLILIFLNSIGRRSAS